LDGVSVDVRHFPANFLLGVFADESVAPYRLGGFCPRDSVDFCSMGTE
jgi:hypothetical protein